MGFLKYVRFCFLFMSVGIGLPKIASASVLNPDGTITLGPMSRFYRYAQISGIHVRENNPAVPRAFFLDTIPPYLVRSATNLIDFGYMRRPGAGKEIPFTDEFSVSSALGGFKLRARNDINFDLIIWVSIVYLYYLF